jgi:deoxyribonuclease-1
LKSCGYKIHKDPKRAERLEWEHVVPAEAFGHSFVEWREGSNQCVHRGKRFKGRKCAQNNPAFARMEADLYNLWPEVGELNGLRNNFSMAELGAEKSGQGDFGGCKAKIEDRKFEPMPQAKGRVARVYLYMDQAYPGRGIISDKNKKLFEAWDKLHPVDAWECRRAKKIEAIQGNENPILKQRCK